MPLPDDLLAQAKLLAGLEAKRPKQSSLRRAVSTAYYALFHLLSDAASKTVSRGYSEELGLLLRRTLMHRDMNEACLNVTRGKLVSSSHQLRHPISNDLKIVANAFVSLQSARHRADYDLDCSFNRVQVLAHVREVENAFRSWRKESGEKNSKIFLISLLMYPRWKARS